MKAAQDTGYAPLAALERYVAKTVLPHLRLTGTSFRLVPTDLGNRNRIFLLHLGSGTTLILKGFAKKRRLQNSLSASLLLQRCNLKAPQIFFADKHDRTRQDLGYYFCCEEHISGSTLADLRDRQGVLPAIAAFYARMHAMRSKRWGKLNASHWFGFARYIMGKAAQRLRRLENSFSDVGGMPDVRRHLAWLMAHKKAVGGIRQFSLCHSDVNLRNILITADQQVCIIDNEALKYLPFTLEFFRLKLTLAADDPQAQDIFEKAYLQHCAPAALEEFERTRQFFYAYVLLEYLSYCERQRRHPDIDETARAAYGSRCHQLISSLGGFVA